MKHLGGVAENLLTLKPSILNRKDSHILCLMGQPAAGILARG